MPLQVAGGSNLERSALTFHRVVFNLDPSRRLTASHGSSSAVSVPVRKLGRVDSTAWEDNHDEACIYAVERCFRYMTPDRNWRCADSTSHSRWNETGHLSFEEASYLYAGLVSAAFAVRPAQRGKRRSTIGAKTGIRNSDNSIKQIRTSLHQAALFCLR